jgi:sugar lactone lactonase YvrE
MKSTPAEIIREYGPFPGVEAVHGVTFDGRNVWFASGDRINALDPDTGRTIRSIAVPAHAGTAFDGRHLFQIAESRIQKIDPETGVVLATIPAPGGGGDSGLAWAEGTLWVTWESEQSEIRRIDPDTGKVLERLEMPADAGLSGLEADGKDRFFCGGGPSGKLRAVRRPKR